MAYLAARRAEFAATLLLRADYPVALVGKSIGWPDPSYFARRFKAHFGLSATAFRERSLIAGTKSDVTHSHDRLM
jgi:AraC family L-rhamnose operon transcriptional activator RhaR